MNSSLDLFVDFSDDSDSENVISTKFKFGEKQKQLGSQELGAQHLIKTNRNESSSLLLNSKPTGNNNNSNLVVSEQKTNKQISQSDFLSQALEYVSTSSGSSFNDTEELKTVPTIEFKQNNNSASEVKKTSNPILNHFTLDYTPIKLELKSNEQSTSNADPMPDGFEGSSRSNRHLDVEYIRASSTNIERDKKDESSESGDDSRIGNKVSEFNKLKSKILELDKPLNLPNPILNLPNQKTSNHEILQLYFGANFTDFFLDSDLLLIYLLSGSPQLTIEDFVVGKIKKHYLTLLTHLITNECDRKVEARKIFKLTLLTELSSANMH